MGHTPPPKQKGKNLTVSPITSRDKTPEGTVQVVENIYKRLMKERDYRGALIFVIGIHAGLRSKDILNMKVGMIRYLKSGDECRYKATKTGRNGSFLINDVIFKTKQKYLESVSLHDDHFLFPNRYDPTKPLSGKAVNRMVKEWVRAEGLSDRGIGTHSLRKTGGLLYRWGGNDPALVGKMLGHTNPEVTNIYLGLQSWEVLEMQRRSSVFKDK